MIIVEARSYYKDTLEISVGSEFYKTLEEINIDKVIKDSKEVMKLFSYQARNDEQDGQ